MKPHWPLLRLRFCSWSAMVAIAPCLDTATIAGCCGCFGIVAAALLVVDAAVVTATHAVSAAAKPSATNNYSCFWNQCSFLAFAAAAASVRAGAIAVTAATDDSFSLVNVFFSMWTGIAGGISFGRKKEGHRVYSLSYVLSITKLGRHGISFRCLLEDSF